MFVNKAKRHPIFLFTYSLAMQFGIAEMHSRIHCSWLECGSSQRIALDTCFRRDPFVDLYLNPLLPRCSMSGPLQVPVSLQAAFDSLLFCCCSLHLVSLLAITKKKIEFKCSLNDDSLNVCGRERNVNIRSIQIKVRLCGFCGQKTTLFCFQPMLKFNQNSTNFI